MAADAAGYIYSVNIAGKRVEKYMPDGALVTQWNAGSLPRGATSPADVATDDFCVYVTLWGSEQIQKYCYTSVACSASASTNTRVDSLTCYVVPPDSLPRCGSSGNTLCVLPGGTATVASY